MKKLFISLCLPILVSANLSDKIKARLGLSQVATQMQLDESDLNYLLEKSLSALSPEELSALELLIDKGTFEKLIDIIGGGTKELMIKNGQIDPANKLTLNATYGFSTKSGN